MYSRLPDQEYNWTAAVYGNIEELLPDDTPPPLGKSIVKSTHADATLYHDIPV